MFKIWKSGMDSMLFCTLINEKATVPALCADTATLPRLLLKACASLEPCVRLFMLRVTNACPLPFQLWHWKTCRVFFLIFIYMHLKGSLMQWKRPLPLPPFSPSIPFCLAPPPLVLVPLQKNKMVPTHCYHSPGWMSHIIHLIFTKRIHLYKATIFFICINKSIIYISYLTN